MNLKKRMEEEEGAEEAAQPSPRVKNIQDLEGDRKCRINGANCLFVFRVHFAVYHTVQD